MAKAVALAQGWEYQKHSQFRQVMNQAATMTSGNGLLHGRADILHVNFYELRRGLDAGIIGEDLESIEDLLALLSPLTGLDSR